MPVFKVAEAKTGNFTTRSIRLPSTNVSASVTTTIGATPTVTVTLDGSHDNTNWVVGTGGATATITTATVTKLVRASGECYEWYRLNFTANTNVTVTIAFIAGTEF